MKYIFLKDKKAFCTDLKSIYGAPNKENASQNLEKVTTKWNEKYPNSMKSCELKTVIVLGKYFTFFNIYVSI